MFRTAITGALIFAAGSVAAGDAGVQRKLYDRVDVPANHEAVLGSADLPLGVGLGRHIHHGVEFGYVAEGEVEFQVDGAAPYRVKAGGFYKIETGKIHDARAVGGPAKVVATWVIEKGKPLAEPAK